MTDTLRDRIAAVLREHVEDQLTNYDAGRNECGCGNQGLSGYVEHVADAVIRELPELTALRRCERCRLPYRPDEYPPMRDGADELRPFCIRCTNYIEWATS